MNDLPYLLGTPIADNTWDIQDYDQANESIRWVWLQRGANSAYVIYPSQDAVLLPNNQLVPASVDQMTLRFAGDPEQELVFTRFGNAQFTLITDTAEVRYTAVAGNAAVGVYPGDLSIDAREIHIEGELALEGSLALDARDMLALYGAIDVQDQIAVNADAGVIMGSVRRNDSVLLDACGIYSDVTNIHFETSINTKACFGDFILVPEIDLEHEPAQATSAPIDAHNSNHAKGGSSDGLLLSLLAILAGFVRVSRQQGQ